MPQDQSTTEACLVTRTAGSWREVYRLPLGQILTVGRGPDNRIVLSDERCSRRHCDVFDEHGHWVVRDLESRNGTQVNGTRITGEAQLVEGDVLRIGATELLFTTDISQPLDRYLDSSESSSIAETSKTDTASTKEPVILERKSQTRYISADELGTDVVRAGSAREGFARLYRLVVKMMSAANVRSLAEISLDGLLSAVQADIGGVLLYPDPTEENQGPHALRLVAFHAPDQAGYHKVSRRLSEAVVQQQEALLAKDFGSQAADSEFVTLANMQAESVICAPIRLDGTLLGLLHLYSLRADAVLDAEALEFTLAVGDQLALTLNTLRQKESLTDGLKRVRDTNRSLSQMLEIESDLVGDSPTMQRLRDSIGRIAASDAVTLIRGESGVGKELVARAVHFNSDRRSGPCVCLNCAALTETLLESELFGHEKGAFTGATDRKIGKFEQADKGTLFLDEVGEMPPSIQAKFLRVLEGHPFERVGGSTSITVNVRVVAATNRDLEEAVEQGEFRKDLFFRLMILEIHVPPLREHTKDIPDLASHFLDRCCRRIGRNAMRLSSAALAELVRYEWPGNVRELRNVIERAVVLADGEEIRPDQIRFISKPSSSAWLDEDPMWGYEARSLEEMERIHIARTLQWTKWKKREAARILGINRSTLDRKLERYQIQPPAE